MSRNDQPTGTLSLDNQADETRMRRALGLTGGSTPVHQQRPEQARQRHRFAQDGSVPVVVLPRHGDSEHSKERLTALEAAMDAERTAHAATRRALADAQAAQQAAQTRLAHAELAHREALATERQARKSAEDALAAALIVPAPRPPEPLPEPKAKPERAVRKPRISSVPAKDAKPVRWWTPSYRAKGKA